MKWTRLVHARNCVPSTRVVGCTRLGPVRMSLRPILAAERQQLRTWLQVMERREVG
jgi:hypothetical protein